jgi:hypothetical protein
MLSRSILEHYSIQVDLSRLSKLSFDERKAVITLCRAQYHPEIDTRLYTMVSEHIDIIQSQNLDRLFGNPVLSSLLIPVTICAPFPHSDVADIRHKYVMKELQRTQSTV